MERNFTIKLSGREVLLLRAALLWAQGYLEELDREDAAEEIFQLIQHVGNEIREHTFDRNDVLAAERVFR
jgi:hypothetical protein